jgi:glutathione synthase/RimK-type ligase-like ATP-grasp enzyme
MKRIGILHGMERSFPDALIQRINEKNEPGIVAELVKIDKCMQGEATDYHVILDRISQDVPFYRAYLKNAALNGTAVLNNPFWWSADEKFFNNCLATRLGIPVPKTCLLPSNQWPDDTSEASFRNLSMPLDWETMFQYTGFPVYMKPHAGGGWKNVFQLDTKDGFFQSHQTTGQLVMLLQEEIKFDSYFRVYCIGLKDIRIMEYEPRNPHHLRYVHNKFNADQKLLDTIYDYTMRLCEALGYDFNTVEFAVRDGIPYAIDFCNPAPDADLNSVGQENFDWVIESAANMCIRRAKAHKENADNLTWGTYMKNATLGMASGNAIPRFAASENINQ